MKKLILWLLGIDKDIQKELSDLNTTIKNLKEETTKLYKEQLAVYALVEAIDIKDDEFWWDKTTSLQNTDYNDMNRIERIKKTAAGKWIRKHPSIKIHKIFHGGCLSCKTPENDGIGECLGCSYFHFGSSLPDLSKKYND